MMNQHEQLVRHLYDRFNARDIDGVLASVADDVAWANCMEDGGGGHVHGRAAVREYWTRQWAAINPRVEPVSISQAPPFPPASPPSHDIEMIVEAHQVVRDLAGTLLLDETVTHAFRIKDGRVVRFDIRSKSQLSEVKH